MPEWAEILLVSLCGCFLCVLNGWLEHQGQEGREGSRDIQWGVIVSSSGIQLDVVIGSTFSSDPEGGGHGSHV